MLALIIFVSAFVLPCGAAFAAGEDGASLDGGVEVASGDVGASLGGGVEVAAGDAGLAPGAYVVVAHPYYKHPVTEVMEDSGQNPGIGQGMTESVLGKEALLEVYDGGRVFVTVRFSLMDNIENIKLSAQKDAESEYVPTEFTIVKESMGEGADAKADIRFEIPGVDAIARAEFYVIAMGRDVIFFMNFSDPVAGEGDFITSPAPSDEAVPDGSGDVAAAGGDGDGAAAGGDGAATGADTDTDANANAEVGSDETTTAGIDDASADADADEAAADASAGDGKIDVKLFIVIAAVIVAVAVVCGVVLTRGKSRRKPR
ncbi:MAG: hypothetical protein LBL54_05810 [Clostridiales Family XIII bacterium]|jgi:hypothetical protein|nr:hypothetical protein [Clostridiales Family XIII bacterium]